MQQFYKSLSSKARPKVRSPSRSSSNEEDLSQRLEAKLQAAEQKRYALLAVILIGVKKGLLGCLTIIFNFKNGVLLPGRDSSKNIYIFILYVKTLFFPLIISNQSLNDSP